MILIRSSYPESLKLNIKDYKSFFKRLFVEGVYLYVMIGLGRFLSVMRIGDLIEFGGASERFVNIIT